MYYDNVYANNNNKLSRELFDVNKQIASRLKIEYAHEDVSVFSQTMRLDNEMTVLTQAKESAQSGYKFSNQSDVALNDFTNLLTRTKTLLIQAASAANGSVSLDAIASELRGVEKNLKSIANTSINGQYLFAGSAVDIKPIGEDGSYNGNDIAMKAFLGSDNQQQYNVTGAELFLGEELLNTKEITTNVVHKNNIAEYVELYETPADAESVLTPSSTIRQLMGDVDNVSDTIDKHFFYVRGTSSDGVAFKEKFAMNDTQSIDELLTKIGQLYGNTPNLDLVNVKLNNAGQIVVEDKQKGSSKIDFHMVAAVDFSDRTAVGFTDGADVTDIDALDGAETNFKELINPTTPPANLLFVKEFVKSGFTSVASAASNIEGLDYDRVEFEKSGAKLSGNVSQIKKEDNAFATATTKLSEVFSGTMNGSVLKLEGVQIDGTTPYDVNINLLDAGSTFSVGANTYNLYNVDGTPVGASDMSYKQLMDVITMAVTGSLPDGTYTDNAASFHAQVEQGLDLGETYLTYDGKIVFGESNATTTKASLALYDINSDDFSAAASVATFHANNALTVTDAKIDFFKNLDAIISSVEESKTDPDGTTGDPRSLGIQNGIALIDNLVTHTSRVHTVVGANSNALKRSLERTEILELSTMKLRSSIIDTDLAEAFLKLSQLSLNYEAMLSTVGRVSKLSLVNYL